MTLYAEVLNGHKTANELRKALDGNICRCTGYRPINKVLQDIEEAQNVDWKIPQFPEELKQKQTYKKIINPAFQQYQQENYVAIIPTTFQ